MTKKRLLASLPESGAPGRSTYFMSRAARQADVSWLEPEPSERLREAAASSETGGVAFEAEHRVMLVLPPFEVEAALTSEGIVTAPLIELLERPRAYAVFLLRRGGYTIGFFRGDFLADSKTDRRFVKNRHRKGGQSQRRFDRIREKQIHELFGKACEDARTTLTPHESEIEHIFLGGDRQSLIAFRKQCDYFERFGERLMSRLLPVAGDPRRASLDAVPREVWSSEVWMIERG